MTETRTAQPLLFLDIDGVLVTDWSMYQQPVEHAGLIFRPFARECIDALQWLLDRARPRVHIMSTRRFQFSAADMESIWEYHGIRYGPLFLLRRYGEQEGRDFTSPLEEKRYDIESLLSTRRSGQIRYAVIDDEKICVKNLVRTDGKRGLSVEDAKKAVAYLCS